MKATLVRSGLVLGCEYQWYLRAGTSYTLLRADLQIIPGPHDDPAVTPDARPVEGWYVVDASPAVIRGDRTASYTWIGRAFLRSDGRAVVELANIIVEAADLALALGYAIGRELDLSYGELAEAA